MPKTKRPAHRPLKLTQELLKELVQLISTTGCTLKDAAGASGIAAGTLHRWLAQGDESPGIFRELRDGVRKAEHEAKVRDLSTVSKAATAGVWQAAKWRLEVKHPKEFAPRVMIHVREEQTEAIERLQKAFANVDEKLSAADALERACAAIAGEGSAAEDSSGEDGESDSAGGPLGTS